MSAVDTLATGEVPALQVMPVLDADVRAALRDSITRFGVLVPIAVTPEGQIIDGHNRWEIAQELGVSCEQKVYAVSTPEQALELAETLNMDRRHLDRDTRATLAVSLREQGHSLRAIAGALGASKSQVARDLGDEDVPLSHDGTVGTDDNPAVGANVPEPQRVVGIDGRSQPATRRGPWSPDELLQLLDRIDAGEKHDDLAAERGMSRANLRNLLTRARKLRKGETQMDKLERVAESVRVDQIVAAAAEGLSSRQIADRLGIGFEHVRNIVKRNNLDIPADAVVGKSRRIDSNKVADETANTLEGVASSLRLIDPSDLDPAQCAEWATSISESLRVLTRFRNQLKEMTRESE